MAKVKINWLKSVAQSDFRAAEQYLELLFAPQRAQALKKKLHASAMQEFPAKDVLRAAGLAPPKKGDPDVDRQVKKIKAGDGISAVLLVRDEAQARLIVADGFHRVCAVMALDEKASVQCLVA